LQRRRHLAATTRWPKHPGTPRAADHTNVGIKNCKLSIGLRAAVSPLSAIAHRRRAHRLRLQPRQQHRQREAKGRGEIGRDGAWVRREQLRCSQDPPAHFRGGPIRTYSGYPQLVASSAGSPHAHAMLLGRKNPAAAPHWKDRFTWVETLNMFALSVRYLRLAGKNRAIRSLAQKGNQAKFCHRMYVRTNFCSNLFICRSTHARSTVAHIQQFIWYHKPHSTDPGHWNRSFDPASEFLSTHWWSQNPACQCCFYKPLKNCHPASRFLKYSARNRPIFFLYWDFMLDFKEILFWFFKRFYDFLKDFMCF